MSWKNYLSGKSDLLFAMLFVGVIGFIGGGWSGLQAVYASSFIFLGCLFFWI